MAEVFNLLQLNIKLSVNRREWKVKLVCPSIYGGRKAGLKYTNGGPGSSGDSSWI
jgi:hypothetical protein